MAAVVCLKNFHPGLMSKSGLSFPPGVDERQKPSTNFRLSKNTFFIVCVVSAYVAMSCLTLNSHVETLKMVFCAMDSQNKYFWRGAAE